MSAQVTLMSTEIAEILAMIPHQLKVTASYIEAGRALRESNI